MSARPVGKRWSAAGEAARVLRQKFLSCEIDPYNINADEVYNSHTAFMQYDGKAFKTNLSRLAQSIVDAGGIEAWAAKNKGKNGVQKFQFIQFNCFNLFNVIYRHNGEG